MIKDLTKVWRLLPIVLLPVVVFVFYWPALNGFFVRDDWGLVGPPAAARFLADPFSIFSFSPAYGHYAPVAFLYYGVTSLLFGGSPFPYHLVNLVMMSIASVLLFLLLRRYGFTPFPSLFGSLYFSLAVSHLQVPMWITLSNYLLLAIFMLAALYSWEGWMDSRRGRDLGLAVVFGVLGGLVHTLGLVIPLAFLARCLSRGEPLGRARRDAGLAGALLFLLFVLQLAPRLIAGGGTPVPMAKGFAPVAESIRLSLSGTILHSILGLSEDLLPPFFLVAGGSLMALLWAWRRERWRVAVLGLVITLSALFLPAFLQEFPPASFATRYRYMFIPNLGVSLLFAAACQGCVSLSLGRLRRGGRILVAMFLLAFVAQSWNQAARSPGGHFSVLLDQDRYIRQVTATYLDSIERTLASTPCGRIEIYDVPLTRTRPRGMYDLHLLGLDHSTIHSFFLFHRKETNERITWKDYYSPKMPTGSPCSFVAVGGVLAPLTKNPSVEPISRPQ